MLFILFLLCIIPSDSSLFCYYSQSANTIRCGTSQTCATVDYSAALPTGVYKVGPQTTVHGVGWLNLYPYVNGNTWDFHTNVADIGCRGGFGLHQGSNSLGCITVTDASCWNTIYSAVSATRTSVLKMDECSNCYWNTCWGGVHYDSVSRTIYDVLLIAES